MPAYTLSSKHAWGPGRVEATIEQEQIRNQIRRRSRKEPAYTELRVLVRVRLVGGPGARSGTSTPEWARQQKAVRRTVRRALGPARTWMDATPLTQTRIIMCALVQRTLEDGELRKMLTPVLEALQDTVLIGRRRVLPLNYTQQIDRRRAVLITVASEWEMD